MVTPGYLLPSFRSFSLPPPPRQPCRLLPGLAPALPECPVSMCPVPSVPRPVPCAMVSTNSCNPRQGHPGGCSVWRVGLSWSASVGMDMAQHVCVSMWLRPEAYPHPHPLLWAAAQAHGASKPPHSWAVTQTCREEGPESRAAWGPAGCPPPNPAWRESKSPPPPWVLGPACLRRAVPSSLPGRCAHAAHSTTAPSSSPSEQ